jgi:hypothetical protein
VWVWVRVWVWVQCRAPWGPHARTCARRLHARTPARLHAFTHHRCTHNSRTERARGGCTVLEHARAPDMGLVPLVDACALQSIPEGAVARVPGICERFNGLRDPSMTPTMPEQSPTLARRWEFCDYLMLQPRSSYPKVC